MPVNRPAQAQPTIAAPNPYVSVDQPTERVLPVRPPQPAPPIERGPEDDSLKTDRRSLIRAWTFVVVALLVAAGFGILFTELFLL